MPVPFPHHYTATILRADRAHANIEAPPRPALAGGPPPEFDGDASRWSPEHLLLSAIGLCLFTTFEVLAAGARLAVFDWRADVTGDVDRTSAGLAFTGFAISVDLKVEPAEVERARTVLEKAKNHCLVSNALQVPVKLSAQITGVAAAA